MTSLISDEGKPQYLPISEKYALKYYSFLVPQTIMLILLIRSGDPSLCLAFAGFYNIIGSYLPIKAQDQRHWNKLQNANKFLLGPLITSCLTTPFFLYIVWKYYDVIVVANCQSAFSVFLTLFSIGFLISGSIDAAHQLLHRTQPICHFFSYLNLFFMQFTIYPTEHVYLHHKKVGTPEDPITSPKNKSLYAFYFGALYSCYKFNYRYSKKIFAGNVACTIIYNLILVGLALKEGSGLSKALFFSAISYFTLFIMESVEYIEHYALVYRKDEKSQPVTEICSWNTSENEMLNWLIFRFQRHSDHHMNAYKIYPTLDLTNKMPQFPFDFVTGIVMATIPPLWTWLINPLADEIVEKKPAGADHHKLVFRIVTAFRAAFIINFVGKMIAYLLM